MTASFLQIDVRANVFPQICCYQDALLLAKSFGNEKVQIMPTSTKLADVFFFFLSTFQTKLFLKRTLINI